MPVEHLHSFEIPEPDGRPDVLVKCSGCPEQRWHRQSHTRLRHGTYSGEFGNQRKPTLRNGVPTAEHPFKVALSGRAK